MDISRGSATTAGPYDSSVIGRLTKKTIPLHIASFPMELMACTG
jgi:hypothetical protein